jgi:hypothetical protein
MDAVITQYAAHTRATGIVLASTAARETPRQ